MGLGPSKLDISSKVEYCEDVGHRCVYRLKLDSLPIYANADSKKEAVEVLKKEMKRIVDHIQRDVDHLEEIMEDGYFSD